MVPDRTAYGKPGTRASEEDADGSKAPSPSHGGAYVSGRRSQWDQGAEVATADRSDGGRGDRSREADSQGRQRDGVDDAGRGGESSERRSERNPQSLPFLDRAGPPFPAVATLLVRGLPPIATENNIRGLFGREWIQLGRVTVCMYPETSRCKGYAFVDLKNPDQVAYAMNSMNGLDADGVRLSVRLYKAYREGLDTIQVKGAWANKGSWAGKVGGKGLPHGGGAYVRGAGVPVPPPAATHPVEEFGLFIGNLAFRVEEKDVKELMGKHRIPVEGVTMALDRETGKSKGFCFVKVSDSIQAQRAVRVLNNIELHGRQITVELKGAPRPAGAIGAPRPSSSDANTRIFVGGIALACTEEQLKSEFSKCGEVINARIVMDRDTGRSKGFGFVEYANARDVEKAMHRMQGADICGKTVRLALPSATPVAAASKGPGLSGGVPAPSMGGGKGPFKGLSADRKKQMFGSLSRSRSASASRKKRSRSRRRKKRSSSSSSDGAKRKTKKAE